MLNGAPRREGVQDSLAGQADFQPVTIQGPGVMSPRAPQQPSSMSSDIAAQLGRWSAGKLEAAANIQHEKDTMAGALAFQQGKALEDIDMPGNKFALEGYRFMDAQVLASSLLAAQLQDIENNGHTLSQEDFAAQYTNRLDHALQGKDPRTAELVREQMTRQMPTLVSEHTRLNAVYLEGRNFDSLQRSVDVISRDATATEELLAFAQGGEGSASAGLSDARRRAALVGGVVQAFENDNPLAYAVLTGAGVFGESLSQNEAQQLRQAQIAFENRRRNEYDETKFNEQQALLTKIGNGELPPQEAVEQWALVDADYDINMTNAEAGEIYRTATEAGRIARSTRGVLIEEAELRGDTNTVADLIIDSLVQTESSGVSTALRTNADGRSFGGLIQMGQGRLDEWVNATGAAQVTVEQFANLSAAEQQAANRWHVNDLVTTARGTGAIGSTINGVTVTLSGLVAVGHLGGKAGMRRFVESGGTYDPVDAGGTSLTSYLNRHGSGEMLELASPEQRQRSAEQRLATLQARLALPAYELAATELSTLDGQRARGEIGHDFYVDQSRRVFDGYNVERTRADVDHEIQVSEQAERSLFEQSRALAREGANADRVLNLDNANAQILQDRAAFEAAISDPNATAGQLSAAASVFRASRQATLDSFGVAVSDRGNSAADNAIFKQLSAAIDTNRVYAEQGAEISAAVQGGYLASLDPGARRRAFDDHQADVVKHYTSEVQAGRISPDDAIASMAQEMNQFFAQSGFVDPRVQAQMSAAMLGPMVDASGNPNPAIIDTMQQFLSVQAMNPRAAAQFFSAEAQGIAAGIMEVTSSPELLGEGIQAFAVNQQANPRVQNVGEFIARDDTQALIRQVSKEFLQERDIGILHALWQEDATFGQVSDTRRSDAQRLRSDETAERVAAEMQVELTNVYKRSPNIRPSALADLAGEALARRTAVIGGDVVFMRPGSDIGAMFFGGQANEFMSVDGAVNSAVRNWIASDEFQTEFGFGTGSTFAEKLPGFVQGAVDLIPGVEFDPAFSAREAISTGVTGVRPFMVTPGADGRSLWLNVLLPSGDFSEPIAVPMSRVGDLYKQELRGQALR